MEQSGLRSSYPTHRRLATRRSRLWSLRATDPDIESVDVLRRPAPTDAGPNAGVDGRLLATPTNLGYISDALKHYLAITPLIGACPRCAHPEIV
jgi:hypothetical protein